jgi:hypothetical protein
LLRLIHYLILELVSYQRFLLLNWWLCCILYRDCIWLLLLYLNLAIYWYLIMIINILSVMNWNRPNLINWLIFWCNEFLNFKVFTLATSTYNVVNIRLFFILINNRLVLVGSFSHIKNFSFLDGIIHSFAWFGNRRSFLILRNIFLSFSRRLMLSVWNIEFFFIFLLNIFHSFKFRSDSYISINLIC